MFQLALKHVLENSGKDLKSIRCPNGPPSMFMHQAPGGIGTQPPGKQTSICSRKGYDDGNGRSNGGYNHTEDLANLHQKSYSAGKARGALRIDRVRKRKAAETIREQLQNFRVY